jgi:hypothetical protein
MQHQQARRVGPLQILDRHRDWAPGAQLVNQGDNRLHGPELGGRTLAKPPFVVMCRFVVEQPRHLCAAIVGAGVVDGQAVRDHAERAPTFQLLCRTPEDPNTQIDPIVERFRNKAGLPDPGLTGHQERLANPTSDLPHRRPKLLELSGATDQTASRVGADIPRHRGLPTPACRWMAPMSPSLADRFRARPYGTWPAPPRAENQEPGLGPREAVDVQSEAVGRGVGCRVEAH